MNHYFHGAEKTEVEMKESDPTVEQMLKAVTRNMWTQYPIIVLKISLATGPIWFSFSDKLLTCHCPAKVML